MPKWAPPPNYNNWPSIFWRPFLVVTLALQNNDVIHLHAPRKFFPYLTWGPWAYVRPPTGLEGVRGVFPPALHIHLFPCHIIYSHVQCNSYKHKKLIRRWDSERELSLRRHCTRSKNTIDSCINSATDRILQHKFTKFSEITQCNGHYAVQGHSRSPILVPIESSYTTSY